MSKTQGQKEKFLEELGLIALKKKVYLVGGRIISRICGSAMPSSPESRIISNKCFYI